MGTASSVSITMLGFLAPCLLLLAALAEGRPQEEWATYKAIYGKEYSGAEDLVRYSRWLKNKEVVDAHNSGDHSYKMALMEHSDWTEEEVNEMRLGFIPAQYDTKMELDTFEGVTTPTSIDYRNNGMVTGVKNQGQCGSCWAFSATGAMEGAWKKKHGSLISMSEQQLVDYGPGSCQGGMMDSAWGTARNGIESEQAYPYTARDGSCKFNPNMVVARAAGHRYVSHSESALESALYTVGHPISIAVHVGSSFQHYSHGIYSDPNCRYGQLNHAVLLVGYNKDSWGQGYWIVKNSWGSGWGQGGYIHMKMGENSCGLANSGMYPLV